MTSFEHDSTHGTSYVRLSDEVIVRTVELAPGFVVDEDASGCVVGIELLFEGDGN